jgi:hypothetical protein
MRRVITSAAALALSGVLAAVVLAGTVNGTAKNDTLRGSAKADAINGKAGNDKLYGLAGNDKLVGAAGNDLLVGGAGADNLNCGAGSDSAQADDSDVVSPNCEKVTGITPPVASIADATVAEGNAGAASLAFQVTLSKAPKRAASVQYATADGSATSPADYSGANGTLTFAPGQTAKTINVSVAGESAYEPDETLTVSLSGPVNAKIVDGSATGTITNDDTPAMPGHYAGKSSQNEVFDFDVTPSGTEVTSIKTGQVNQSCSPGGTLSGGNLNLTSTYPIAADGSFTINPILIGTVRSGGEVAVTLNRVSIAGRFSGATASGTLLITTTFTLGGTSYSCTSNSQTWTANRA